MRLLDYVGKVHVHSKVGRSLKSHPHWYYGFDVTQDFVLPPLCCEVDFSQS